MRRFKLLLVNPVNHKRFGYYRLPGERYAPLNLVYVASLTPADWDVKIADENFGEMKFEEADLVALTSLTATANRAYQIAGRYRQKHIPTVIGGMHATLLPEEAGQFVDTVVVGDAEDTWPRLIADFEAGGLQPRYTGSRLPLGRLPKLRRDLLSSAYLAATVETSRGCPMRCDFCAVNAVHGGEYRLRPVEDVLDEIAAIDKKMIYFVDDNIVGYGPKSRERAQRLFQGLIDRKLNKHWFAAASMNLGEDDALLALARRSGCRMVALGVESEDAAGLAEINKKLNVSLGTQNYEKIFRRINRHKIAVVGNFIIGLDSDTREKLQAKTRYMLASGLNTIGSLPLTPLPGTEIFEKMKKENRLLYTHFPEDWERYDVTEIVFAPKNLTQEELLQVLRDIARKIFSWRMICLRFFKAWLRTRSLTGSLWSLFSSLDMRQMTFYCLANHIRKSGPPAGEKTALRGSDAQA